MKSRRGSKRCRLNGFDLRGIAFHMAIVGASLLGLWLLKTWSDGELIDKDNIIGGAIQSGIAGMLGGALKFFGDNSGIGYVEQQDDNDGYW